jgi:hypothetical protein
MHNGESNSTNNGGTNVDGLNTPTKEHLQCMMQHNTNKHVIINIALSSEVTIW